MSFFIFKIPESREYDLCFLTSPGQGFVFLAVMGQWIYIFIVSDFIIPNYLLAIIAISVKMLAYDLKADCLFYLSK